jgi:MFS family permease
VVRDPVVSPQHGGYYAQRLPNASQVRTRAADHPNGTGTAPSGGDPVARASPVASSASLTIAALAGDLGASPGATTWVLTAFLLTSAVLAPLVSSLGDRYGKRRLLLVVLWVYLVGTVGAMLAWNLGALVGFRAVQGVSLAVLPLGFAILREAVPAGRVALGVGVVSGVLGGGAGIGLVAGGLIVDHGSWRWLFALGAATAVGALWLVARHVPESTVRSVRRLDLAGSGVLALALTALLLALTVGVDQGVPGVVLDRPALRPAAHSHRPGPDRELLRARHGRVAPPGAHPRP